MFISAQNAHWLKQLWITLIFTLNWDASLWDLHQDEPHKLLFPYKNLEPSKPLLSRPIIMRMHPREPISVLSWYSRNLIISLSKLIFKLEQRKHIKNFKNIQICAIFELFQIFGMYFSSHIPPIRLHGSTVSEKTLKFISFSSKNIGDQKSCQKISIDKFFLFFFVSRMKNLY